MGRHEWAWFGRDKEWTEGRFFGGGTPGKPGANQTIGRSPPSGTCKAGTACDGGRVVRVGLPAGDTVAEDVAHNSQRCRDRLPGRLVAHEVSNCQKEGMGAGHPSRQPPGESVATLTAPWEVTAMAMGHRGAARGRMGGTWGVLALAIWGALPTGTGLLGSLQPVVCAAVCIWRAWASAAGGFCSVVGSR